MNNEKLVGQNNKQMNSQSSSQDGRVLPPLLLYFFGLPAGICLLLWLLFFRG